MLDSQYLRRLGKLVAYKLFVKRLADSDIDLFGAYDITAILDAADMKVDYTSEQIVDIVGDDFKIGMNDGIEEIEGLMQGLEDKLKGSNRYGQ